MRSNEKATSMSYVLILSNSNELNKSPKIMECSDASLPFSSSSSSSFSPLTNVSNFCFNSSSDIPHTVSVCGFMLP